jgi:hypothetical protein
MLPFGFRRHEEQLGFCFMAVCPHCLTMGAFTLRQMKGGVHLFGFQLFDFDSTYHIACGCCRFKRDLDEAEVPVAMAAQDLYRRHAAKQMDAVEYAQALDALRFPALRELRRAAQVWRCPVCSETVPASLVACWECTTPRSPNVRIKSAV